MPALHSLTMQGERIDLVPPKYTDQIDGPIRSNRTMVPSLMSLTSLTTLQLEFEFEGLQYGKRRLRSLSIQRVSSVRVLKIEIVPCRQLLSTMHFSNLTSPSISLNIPNVGPFLPGRVSG